MLSPLAKGWNNFSQMPFCRMSDNDIKAYWDHQKQHSDWFCGHLLQVEKLGQDGQCWVVWWRSASLPKFWVWSGFRFLDGHPSYISMTTLSYGICNYDLVRASRVLETRIMMQLVMLSNLSESWWSKLGLGATKATWYFSPLPRAISSGYPNEWGGIHNFRRNEFVPGANAWKPTPDVFATLPYFPSNHEHFGAKIFTPAQLANFSPLFTLPLTMERVQHDVAHSQLLGTGKTSNGASMWSLVSFSLQLSTDVGAMEYTYLLCWNLWLLRCGPHSHVWSSLFWINGTTWRIQREIGTCPT